MGAAVDAVDLLPPEEDVAGGLHQPLALDNPLAMVAVPALVKEWFEHRCLRFFHLQEERIGVVPADQQGDPRPHADTADTDHLAREMNESIGLEEAASIPGERSAIRAERFVDLGLYLLGRVVCEHLFHRHDQRWIADELQLTVDLAGQLGQGLQAVFRLRLGDRSLQVLERLRAGFGTPAGLDLVRVELGVPEIQVRHGGEGSHRLAVGLRGRRDRARHVAAVSSPRSRPATSKLATSRLMSHSNGPASVSSKSLTSNTSERSAEAKPPKFAKWASPQSCTFNPECGAEARSAAITFGRAPVERERRNRHAPVADGHQVVDSGRGLLLEQRDRLAAGGRRPFAVARSGYLFALGFAQRDAFFDGGMGYGLSSCGHVGGS